MPTADSGAVLLEEQRGRIRILTLNRPRSRNALSTELIAAVRDALARADTDNLVDVVILTGADPAFCAGLDLRELGSSGKNAAAISGQEIPVGHPWRPLSKPLIGAINGAAITGGLEFALACDFLIASERATFADTHARVGVLPGWGLTYRLPAAVGTGLARRMSLSGDFLDAKRALRAGLVTEVVAHDRLMEAAVDVAVSIVGNDQPGVRTLLDSYRRSHDHIVNQALQVEDSTSQQWMADFDPSMVAERREAVIDRGRSQGGATA
ncbi:enoyl-CoA hydratase (plasmid) [Rhodococcus sp. BH4]|uniref:enoyl-CoA hydratase n=1 Tax=Rhodococcus sp. BH4 TaxID=1807790 RepID=UPI0009C2AF07|nr:enoyl-CoA hydratase [Rhodococcus sp. BH4]ARE37841.1 enoyl-CoA hydratase [Rhodococcus sp. BH4]